MSIFSGIVNYQNFEVESGITSNFFISPTISANTISGGSLSVSFIGNKNVTNQEFKYLSGTTSNIQIQLNNLPGRDVRFLTFSATSILNNEYLLTSKDNSVTSSITSTDIILNTTLTSTEFKSTFYTFITESAITEWIVSSSTSHIIISSSSQIPSIISGINSLGTGMILFITNNSKYPIIFEHNSSKTNENFRINFSHGEAYFLRSFSTMGIIYDNITNKWVELFPTNNRSSMFKFYTDFEDSAIEIGRGTGSSSYALSGNILEQFRGSTNFKYISVNNGPSCISLWGSGSVTYCNGRSSTSPNNTSISSSLLITKVKLTKDVVFNPNFSSLSTSSDFCLFGSNTHTQSYFTDCEFRFGTKAFWITSGQTWGTSYGAQFEPIFPTSVSIENFVYLGIINNSTYISVWFPYSFNGCEYNWARQRNGVTALANDGNIFLWSRNASGNEFIIDWYGLGNNG